MRPQLALRLIGGGLVLQGLLFYGFATPLTIQIFPGASDEAVHVGMIMRRGLAAMSFLADWSFFWFAMMHIEQQNACYSAVVSDLSPLPCH
jgi:hypothetical protein